MSGPTPIHASHVQPSDIGEILPVAASERVTASKQDILIAGIFHRWVAPAAGILEEGWFNVAVCGTGAGPNTMDIQKNGTTTLTAVMSIAHDATDGTTVSASFDGTETVNKGDVITMVSSAGATVQTQASAGYKFRAFGR